MYDSVKLALFVGLLYSLLSVGCSEEDYDEKSPCQKQWTVVKEVADDYCASRGNECCICKCYNQLAAGYIINSYRVEGVCECAGVQGQEFDLGYDECIGGWLEEAKDCLADKAACRALSLQKGEASCQNTPI